MQALQTTASAARLFSALGDATRRAIVDQLCGGPLTVSQLSNSLDITLTAVRQHLHVLEDCGLAKTEKVGRVRHCRFSPGGLAVLSSWIAEHQSVWESRLDKLGDILDEA